MMTGSARFMIKPLSLASLIALGLCNAASAWDDALPMKNPHLWKPKTQSVSVFKNGLGFFTQEAPVSLNDGWCYASQIPPAAFGTLAVYSSRQDQVVDVVGAGAGDVIEFDRQDVEGDAQLKRKTLDAYCGLKIQLDYDHSTGDRKAAGLLLSVSDDFAAVETDQQTLAVPLAKITRVQLQDLPVRVHVADENGISAKETQLGIAYLRTGIVWIPEYTLRLIDDETAELTLRGTLINDAEDIVDCDVNFVVGVPHFVHSQLMSPVAVGRAIRAIGSALPNGVPQQVMSQVMNRAAIANNSLTSDPFLSGSEGVPDATPAEFREMLGNLPSMESAGAGDFTVYTKTNLTVRQGERAMVTLLTQKIRYGHRYRWDVGSDIKHLLTLENSTTSPWTTGPCLAISGLQPLSEDLLKYTPVGARGELEVTTAINVANVVAEEEVKRSPKAHEPRDNEYFDLVTIRGSIRLKSYEKGPVEVNVSAPINGHPIEASNDGKMKIDATKLRLIERSGTIDWRITLQPGEEYSVDYQYERYVPSN